MPSTASVIPTPSARTPDPVRGARSVTKVGALPVAGNSRLLSMYGAPSRTSQKRPETSEEGATLATVADDE